MEQSFDYLLDRFQELLKPYGGVFEHVRLMPDSDGELTVVEIRCNLKGSDLD